MNFLTGQNSMAAGTEPMVTTQLLQGTIICVDDEPLVLCSLRDQLIRIVGDEYAIEVAGSGEEVLEIFADLYQADIAVPLIICDQIMPTLPGDELLIRVHQRYPDTVKILLTGQADTQAIIKAVNLANLYRYLTKPWNELELELAVKEALKSYWQGRQLIEQHQALQQANQFLENLNLSLEQRVADRTSELRLANEQLQQAKQAAEMASQVKSIFLENMSHELRTPLNIILGFTQVLSQGSNLGVDQQTYLNAMEQSGQQLLKLINDVLAIARIQSDGTSLDVTHMNLDQILNNSSTEQSINSCSAGPSSWNPCSLDKENLPCEQLVGQLRQMPDTWRMQLHKAANRLSDSEIFQLIEQIPEAQEALATSLGNLAYNFQFERIVELTEMASQGI